MNNDEREFTPLTENRLRHMNAVANRAYTLAKIMFGKTEYLARKMYIYGLLHDVGVDAVRGLMKRAWTAEKAMYGVGDSASRVDKALRMKKDSFRCLFS